MKETYNGIDLSVTTLDDDVITVSKSDDEHDNGYIDWDELE